jgi:hypothetical protein
LARPGWNVSYEARGRSIASVKSRLSKVCKEMQLNWCLVKRVKGSGAIDHNTNWADEGSSKKIITVS